MRPCGGTLWSTSPGTVRIPLSILFCLGLQKFNLQGCGNYVWRHVVEHLAWNRAHIPSNSIPYQNFSVRTSEGQNVELRIKKSKVYDRGTTVRDHSVQYLAWNHAHIPLQICSFRFPRSTERLTVLFTSAHVHEIINWLSCS